MAQKKNNKQLKDAVGRFYGALENCHPKLGIGFECFPRGCCSDASQLLAAYLKDEGFGVFSLRVAWTPDRGVSHAWLERDGLIVDVTYAQFHEKGRERFLFEGKSWHSNFVVEEQQCHDDGDFRGKPWEAELSHKYYTVRGALGV